MTHETSHFELVLPTHSVRWYEKGEHCDDPQNGDILLVDHGSLASDLVEAAEKVASLREPELRPYTWCGHAGIIRTDLLGEPLVSEMEGHGYERHSLLAYQARLYAVVNLQTTDAQRAVASQYDDSISGADYGWLEYPGMVLDDALGLQLSISWANHLVCSAATMLVASAMGFFGDRLAVRTEPARIAMWVGADR